VIPLAAALLYLLVTHGPAAGIRRFFTDTGMLYGIPILLVIVVPWHVLAWQANGRPFTDEYIIKQHLGRFRGGDTAHRAPFWFFVPGFLLGFFPWSLFTVAALAERFPRKVKPVRNGPEDARRLCKIWFALVFIMFSASGSKLISYILPLYAPAALLAADWAVRSVAKKENVTRLLWAMGIAALVSFFVFIAALLHEHIIAQIESATRRNVSMQDVSGDIVQFALWLTGAAAAACSAAWIAALWKQSPSSLWTLTAGMAAFIGIAVVLGFPAVDSAYLTPFHNAVAFAGRNTAREGRVVVVTSSRRPSALFYLPDRFLARSDAGRTAVIEISDPDTAPERLPRPPFSLIFPLSERATFRGIGEIAGVNDKWAIIRVR
jgi:4-amino-4-deoxy-L-arabinose transferase-like glycosyltransferase